MVELPSAVGNPRAVVIHPLNALIALSTMMSPRVFDSLALEAIRQLRDRLQHVKALFVCGGLHALVLHLNVDASGVGRFYRAVLWPWLALQICLLRMRDLPLPHFLSDFYLLFTSLLDVFNFLFLEIGVQIIWQVAGICSDGLVIGDPE